MWAALYVHCTGVFLCINRANHVTLCLPVARSFPLFKIVSEELEQAAIMGTAVEAEHGGLKRSQ